MNELFLSKYCLSLHVNQELDVNLSLGSEDRQAIRHTESCLCCPAPEWDPVWSRECPVSACSVYVCVRSRVALGVCGREAVSGGSVREPEEQMFVEGR